LHFGIVSGAVDRREIPAVAGREDEFLTGYAMTVQCSTSTPQQSERPAGVTLVTSDQGLPWRSLNWIVHMAGLAPNQRLKKLRGGGLITAAMRLRSGRLEAAPPVTKELSDILWSVGGASPQALTDRVQYTLECPNGPVELLLRPFDGADTRTIRL